MTQKVIELLAHHEDPRGYVSDNPVEALKETRRGHRGASEYLPVSACDVLVAKVKYLTDLFLRQSPRQVLLVGQDEETRPCELVYHRKGGQPNLGVTFS